MRFVSSFGSYGRVAEWNLTGTRATALTRASQAVAVRPAGGARETAKTQHLLFDRKCMEVSIEQAGELAESILPPPASCWIVVQDFARCLPGKCEGDSVYDD